MPKNNSSTNSKSSKKEWTEEERKAFGAKMKAARKNKVSKEPEVLTEINNEPSVTELLAMIEELKRNQSVPQQAVVTTTGIVGIVDKYSVNPDDYTDPSERLANEPRLKQFAFDINYDLGWKMDDVVYETKDGRSVREPRFTIQLNKILLNESGEDDGKRLVRKRMTMFEDPLSAITVARQNGLNVDDNNSKDFLDEMRYLRVRNWLFDIFFPQKATYGRGTNQEVIGGKLVEVFTASSEDTTKIPFDKLNNKL